MNRKQVKEILKSCDRKVTEEMVNITMIMQINISGNDKRLRNTLKTRSLEYSCECDGEIICGYMNLGVIGHALDVNFHYCRGCEDAHYSESFPRDDEETGYEGVCNFCNYNWLNKVENIAGCCE